MRNLASVQKISAITPINGADRVVLANFANIGWQCVVSKEDFKVGDLGVYIEIDSLVPKTQAFEFMLKCKYRVKSIKLRGVLSQGLAIPFSKFPDKDFSNFIEGDDLTEFLGITKYEKEIGPDNQKPVVKKWYDPIKRTKFYRKHIQPFFDKVDPKHFPVNLIKESDETRIQNMPWILEKDADVEYEITEKCEGSSASYLLENKWFRKSFHVCSHHTRIPKENDSNWWQIERKFQIRKTLEKLMRNDIRSWSIQGEIIGPKIQGNIYGLSELDFRVFRMKVVYKNGETYFYKPSHGEATLSPYGLKWVPIIGKCHLRDFTLESILKFADGKSVMGDHKREGFVFVCNDPLKQDYSFKVVSNEYILEKEKKAAKTEVE